MRCCGIFVGNTGVEVVFLVFDFEFEGFLGLELSFLCCCRWMVKLKVEWRVGG